MSFTYKTFQIQILNMPTVTISFIFIERKFTFSATANKSFGLQKGIFVRYIKKKQYPKSIKAKISFLEQGKSLFFLWSKSSVESQRGLWICEGILPVLWVAAGGLTRYLGFVRLLTSGPLIYRKGRGVTINNLFLFVIALQACTGFVVMRLNLYFWYNCTIALFWMIWCLLWRGTVNICY